MPSRGDDLEAVTAGDVVSHLGNRSAVYRSQDGSELRALKGIFRRSYVEVPGEFAGTAVRRPTYTTLEAYWPETFKPQVGGTLEVCWIRKRLPRTESRVLSRMGLGWWC